MTISTTGVPADQAMPLIAAAERQFFDLKAVNLSALGPTKTLSASPKVRGREQFVRIDEHIGAISIDWPGFARVEAASAHVQAVEQLSQLSNHHVTTLS